MQIKLEAVRVLVEDLLPSSRYWSIFGENWRRPEYYSLILQPFIISPCINTGDILSAMNAHPEWSLDAAMRNMHPFPVFERFVDHDIIHGGKVCVKSGSDNS